MIRVVNFPEILAKAGSFNVYNFYSNLLIFLGAVLKTKQVIISSI